MTLLSQCFDRFIVSAIPKELSKEFLDCHAGFVHEVLDAVYCPICISEDSEDVEQQVEFLREDLGVKRFNILLILHLVRRLGRICERIEARPRSLLPALLEDNAVRHWQFVYWVLRLEDMSKEHLIMRWLNSLSDPELSDQCGVEVCDHLIQTCTYILSDTESGQLISHKQQDYLADDLTNIIRGISLNNKDTSSVDPSSPNYSPRPIILCDCEDQTDDGQSYMTISQILNNYFTYHEPVHSPAHEEGRSVYNQTVTVNISKSDVKVTEKKTPRKSPRKTTEKNFADDGKSQQKSPKRVLSFDNVRCSPRKLTPVSQGPSAPALNLQPVLRRSPRKSDPTNQTLPNPRKSHYISPDKPTTEGTKECMMSLRQSPRKSTGNTADQTERNASASELRRSPRKDTTFRTAADADKTHFPDLPETKSISRNQEGPPVKELISADKATSTKADPKKSDTRRSQPRKILKETKKTNSKQSQYKLSLHRLRPRNRGRSLRVQRSKRQSNRKSITTSKKSLKKADAPPAEENHTVSSPTVTSPSQNAAIIRAGTPVEEEQTTPNQIEKDPGNIRSNSKSSEAKSSCPAKRQPALLHKRKNSKGSKLNLLMKKKKAKLSQFKKSLIKLRPRNKSLPINTVFQRKASLKTVKDSTSPTENTRLQTEASMQIENKSSPVSKHIDDRAQKRSTRVISKRTSPRVQLPDALHELLNEPILESSAVGSPVTRSRSSLTKQSLSQSPASRPLKDIRSEQSERLRSSPQVRSEAARSTRQSSPSPKRRRGPTSLSEQSSEGHSFATPTMVTAQSPGDPDSQSSPEWTLSSDQFLQLVVTPEGEAFTSRPSPISTSTSPRKPGNTRNRPATIGLNQTATQEFVGKASKRGQASEEVRETGNTSPISGEKGDNSPAIKYYSYSVTDGGYVDESSDDSELPTGASAYWGKGYKWTLHEDRKLYNLVSPYVQTKMEIDFKEVSKAFPYRSIDSIRNHWSKIRKKKAYLQYSLKADEKSPSAGDHFAMAHSSINQSVASTVAPINKSFVPIKKIRNNQIKSPERTRSLRKQPTVIKQSQTNVTDQSEPINVNQSESTLANQSDSITIHQSPFSITDTNSVGDTSIVTVHGAGYKWTLDDDKILYSLIKGYMSKGQTPDYAQIQTHLPHRSTDSIRNHWASLKKRKSYIYKYLCPVVKVRKDEG